MEKEIKRKQVEYESMLNRATDEERIKQEEEHNLLKRKNMVEEEARLHAMRKVAEKELEEETRLLREREHTLMEEQGKSQRLIQSLRNRVSSLEERNHLMGFEEAVGDIKRDGG